MVKTRSHWVKVKIFDYVCRLFFDLFLLILWSFSLPLRMNRPLRGISGTVSQTVYIFQVPWEFAWHSTNLFLMKFYLNNNQSLFCVEIRETMIQLTVWKQTPFLVVFDVFLPLVAWSTNRIKLDSSANIGSEIDFLLSNLGSMAQHVTVPLFFHRGRQCQRPIVRR